MSKSVGDLTVDLEIAEEREAMKLTALIEAAYGMGRGVYTIAQVDDLKLAAKQWTNSKHATGRCIRKLGERP